LAQLLGALFGLDYGFLGGLGELGGEAFFGLSAPDLS
jgi:hypothetical protein